MVLSSPSWSLNTISIPRLVKSAGCESHERREDKRNVAEADRLDLAENLTPSLAESRLKERGVDLLRVLATCLTVSSASLWNETVVNGLRH
mmetsp:Transcript_114694/g.180575  ORF Transcript_114694/g.180575 Transcript_114694/m.180575 type:complete len:91 (-) Transcript_114694:532-804(-)